MRYESRMNRRSLAASVFGLSSAVVVAVACGGGAAKPPQQPITNNTVEPGDGSTAGAEAGLPAGVTNNALWTCQISDYDAQPCAFRKDGNEWTLTKLLGSQRFTGVTTFGDDGIHFVGQFFCPWGACDEAMDLMFEREGNGYRAEFSGDMVTARWDEALASEWGGAGYGNLTGREAD